METRIWCISDTHEEHRSLIIPDNIDIVIYAGDESNSRDKYINEPKARDFFHWFSKLDISHKVYIAGNHSSAVYHKLITQEELKMMGIEYLEDKLIEINGIRIYGSPWTSKFGEWWFMKERSKLDAIWQNIPENLDILVTHGPPKGILDLTDYPELEQCGDKALFNHVIRAKPKYHMFGHIHNSRDGKSLNSGSLKLSGIDTTFMNVSCVTDGRFNMGCTSHGQVITINK